MEKFTSVNINIENRQMFSFVLGSQRLWKNFILLSKFWIQICLQQTIKYIFIRTFKYSKIISLF